MLKRLLLVVALSIGLPALLLAQGGGQFGGVGGGSGSGTTTNQTKNGIASNSSGTATAIDSVVCTPPATNGIYGVEYTVTASASVAPDCNQVGVGVRVISGATSTDTVGASTVNDSVCIPIFHDIAGSAAVTITIPTPPTLTNTNACVIYDNHSAQTDTLKATTWTIQANGAAAVAGATGISVPPATRVTAVVDKFNATQWLVDTVPLGGSASTFPVTVSGTVNSGGIPCFSNATTESSSPALAAGVLPKGGGAGACVSASSITDNGTTATSTDTGGYVAPVFVSNGTTAGFVDYPQGSTSAAVAPCNAATSICEQAPASVTSYLVNKPPAAASGIRVNTTAAAVATENFTGSSAFSTGAVTIGSGTSIAATSLCSTTNCPAGNYLVKAYVEITTPCTTTGSYIVWLGWTDDGSAKTGSSTTTFFPFPLNGNGVPTTVGTIVPAAAGNYADGSKFIHTTGAATGGLGSINYGTTATACGSGGPMVGKLFLTVIPVS